MYDSASVLEFLFVWECWLQVGVTIDSCLRTNVCMDSERSDDKKVTDVRGAGSSMYRCRSKTEIKIDT